MENVIFSAVRNIASTHKGKEKLNLITIHPVGKKTS